MIELVQFPWSPFCIVQRQILKFAGARFKVINIPAGERSLVWKLTKERYYQVPVIKDGNTVVFELEDNSQVIAKYLDNKFKLGLFPSELRGVQTVLWRYIEEEVEGCTFKLDDIYWKEIVPKSDQLRYLRHKERKFGRGCFDQWRTQQSQLIKQLEKNLGPFEDMLASHPFLLDTRPRFVDFDLYGMLGNYLYTGRYELPSALVRIRQWYTRMALVRHRKFKL